MFYFVLPVFFLFHIFCILYITNIGGDRRGRDRMVVGIKTTYALNAYHRYIKLRVLIPRSR